MCYSAESMSAQSQREIKKVEIYLEFHYCQVKSSINLRAIREI